MKTGYLFLAMFFHSAVVCSDAVSDPVKIESEASLYRMLAIECITDKKITKKDPSDIQTCNSFRGFVKSRYPELKASLEKAQQQVKLQAQTEGLTSKNVRDSLILLMSARSHMKIAGEIATEI